MPLFTLMVVDGNRNGQVVGFGLVINECSETITKLLQTFVEHNKFCKEEVKTVLIDKDFAEVNAVRNVLPSSNIVICKFHVRQAIDKKLKCYSKEEVMKVNNIVDKMLTSLLEEEYDELFNKLGEEFPQFMPYFVKCWRSCRENWTGCFVRQYTTFGNLTTNFVESHHSKIKLNVGKDTSIPSLLEELLKMSTSKHIKAQGMRRKRKF